MKILFSALLFTLSTVVHADQVFNNEKCLELYRTFLTDFAASQSQQDAQMIYFGQMCMQQSNYIEGSNLRYDDLLRAMASDEHILALEASLVKQGLQ